jgi:hypothetical protein
VGTDEIAASENGAVIGRGDLATKWIAPAELSAIRLSVAFLILSGLAHSRYVVFGANAYDAERARSSQPPISIAAFVLSAKF